MGIDGDNGMMLFISGIITSIAVGTLTTAAIGWLTLAAWITVMCVADEYLKRKDNS